MMKVFSSMVGSIVMTRVFILPVSAFSGEDFACEAQCVDVHWNPAGVMSYENKRMLDSSGTILSNALDKLKAKCGGRLLDSFRYYSDGNCVESGCSVDPSESVPATIRRNCWNTRQSLNQLNDISRSLAALQEPGNQISAVSVFDSTGGTEKRLPVPSQIAAIDDKFEEMAQSSLASGGK